MCELDVRSCEHLLGEQIKLSHIYTNFGNAVRSQFFTCKQNFEYFFACNLNSSLEMFTRHCVPYLLIRFLSFFLPFSFRFISRFEKFLSPSRLPVLENCVSTCKLAIHVHRRHAIRTRVQSEFPMRSLSTSKIFIFWVHHTIYSYFRFFHRRLYVETETRIYWKYIYSLFIDINI